MVIAEIDFSRENVRDGIRSLDWLAERLTGLLGCQGPTFYADADKWILGTTNNYWLHWNDFSKTASISSRYSLKAEEKSAIRTILTSLWGFQLKEPV